MTGSFLRAIRNPLRAAGKVWRLATRKVLPGFCIICGSENTFYHAGTNRRESYQCRGCGSISRNRQLAAVLYAAYGLDPLGPLEAILEARPGLQVFEAQARGPVHDVLKKLSGYVGAEFFPNVAPGKPGPGGVRSEDLEQLTFGADSFDLIITQDVFEHVRQPAAAWAEIRRVLKPGGRHLFTIPFVADEPSRVRVRLNDGREDYLLPKVFHGDGIRDGLVVTDFGGDLIGHLDGLGLATELFSAADLNLEPEQHHIYEGVVLISTKTLSPENPPQRELP